MTTTNTANGAATAVENVWLRRYSEVPDPAHRLVCFPHAGGSAAVYLPFARRLARDGIEVHAVQYPGRHDRRQEPFVETIGDLVEGVLPELSRLQADGVPVALFGHSMGATTAYETARRLATTAGAAPLAHLFVSGRSGPTLSRRETLHLLDDRDLTDHMRVLQGTDPSVFADEELVRMVLPVLRGDYRVIGGYTHTPGPAVDIPVTVLTGDADPNVRPAGIRAWREVAVDEPAVHTFPGGHFYLQDEQEAVCRTIARAL